MEQIDFVLLGAEAAMENGGVVNTIGSFQLAMAAKAFGKPLYVALESYKFARMYPLSQKELQGAFVHPPYLGVTNSLSPPRSIKSRAPTKCPLRASNRDENTPFASDKKLHFFDTTSLSFAPFVLTHFQH